MIGRYIGRLVTKVAIRGMVVLAPVAATDQTHIVDLRGELPTNGSYGYRPKEAIEGLVIHHTATAGQTFKRIAEYHVQVKKWPEIGYHYGIGWNEEGKEATIYLFNDPLEWTNHAKGWNYRTVGCVLMGNYENIHMTKEQVLASLKLEAYLRDLYGIRYTKYHSETKSTACPGRFAREALDTALVLH